MKRKEISYILERVLSLIAAMILLQTLFYKFTASPVSVHIFNLLKVEPWGRILTGIIELIAGVTLIFRRTSIYGAILAFLLMVGAILSHILVLGISIKDDSGMLFIMAIVVFTCSLSVLILQIEKFKRVIKLKFK